MYGGGKMSEQNGVGFVEISGFEDESVFGTHPFETRPSWSNVRYVSTAQQCDQTCVKNAFIRRPPA